MIRTYSAITVLASFARSAAVAVPTRKRVDFGTRGRPAGWVDRTAVVRSDTANLDPAA